MSSAPAQTTALGDFRLLGRNDTPIWGMSNAERIRRLVVKAAKAGNRVPEGKALFANLEFAFDPLLLDISLARPDVAIFRDGAFVIGLLPEDWDPERLPAAAERLDLAEGQTFYNKQLRKLQQPFVSRLTPQSVRAIEQQSYQGAYKGVTDLLTKYLWPKWALFLTRVAAQIGLTPNMVTAIGAAFNVAAMIAFWNGRYWLGMALALVFMVLDTVDGKLARCTITSTGWGEVFDHGIDLVHPPFWWWAWAVGLSHWGLAYSTDKFALIMAAILGGYLVQRLIEGAFMRLFGMHIHVWQRIDSQFRLITARRNPNMVILFFATLFARPDLGLELVAWWTMLSCLFHAVRLAQALQRRRNGRAIESWLS